MYEICLARACPHLQNAYQCKTQSKIETRLLFTNKKTVGGMSPAVIFPLIVVGILVFVFFGALYLYSLSKSKARRVVEKDANLDAKLARRVVEKDANLDAKPVFMTIKVATINLFGIYKTDKTLQMLKIGLLNVQPDVVAIQEAPADILTQVPGYDLIYEKGRTGGRGETIACLLAQNSRWWYSSNSTDYETKNCRTARVSAVSKFIHKEDANYTVLVANVHLCGGRFDEATALENEDEIISKKTELFTAYKPKPDIVLGDFNSDVNHFYKNIESEKQINFLTGLGWTRENAAKWNKAPYVWLDQNGYSLVDPETQTSFYGNTPDAIWFQKKNLKWT
jgi:endonuclease/exonuclease/phosphatase family metal-dependent hydrolase